MRTLIFAVLLLAGCGMRSIQTTVTRGTVVSCRDDRGNIDVLSPDGELRHFDVAYHTMPGCFVFKRGGLWEIHSHKNESDMDVIDWMKRTDGGTR